MQVTAMLLALSMAAPAADTKAPASVKVSNCLILAIDDVAVPAQDAGMITAINVKEHGQLPVEKGTLLAQIEDRDLQVKRKLAEIELSAAKEQAESSVSLDVAEKTAAVAKTEWENAVEINAKSPRTVSDTEVRRLKLTYERYVLEAEKAMLEQRVARLTEQAKQSAIEVVEIGRAHV